jgi:mRNA interferase MazF
MAGGPDYAGKPRPALIIQDDAFDATNSIMVCGLTTVELEIQLFRLRIMPTESNGLRAVSWLMVDKISAVPKTRLGKRLGRLDDADMVRLSEAVIVFLGLVPPPRR